MIDKGGGDVSKALSANAPFHLSKGQNEWHFDFFPLKSQ